MNIFFRLYIICLVFSSCEIKLKEEVEQNKIKASTKKERTSTVSLNPEITKSFLLGKFDYKKDPRFILVDAKYNINKNNYLQVKTYNAFVKMAEAAKADGINLKVVSGCINYQEQLRKWNQKWKYNCAKYTSKKRIFIETVKDVKIPSACRNQWGTELILNATTKNYIRTKKGLKEYRWLIENANQFGFCNVYSEIKFKKRGGYPDNPWHWSYKPLSNYYLNQYVKSIQNSDYKKFNGSNFCSSKVFNFKKKYVEAINKDCNL